MSISDLIVVMKDGVIQQIGEPQSVYDDPVNLFVAKFLGTPPINVFKGEVKSGKVYIGEEAVLETDAPEGKVYIGVRPEGFVLGGEGKLTCGLTRVEVMGRDISIVASHDHCDSGKIRAIIDSENLSQVQGASVRFHLKPGKTDLFAMDTEQRIHCTLR